MSTVHLASYTGTHEGWAGWVNRGIRWLDKAPYSHTEICLNNPLTQVTTCLSSSGVDHGVRAKDMQLNPDKWAVLPLPWITAGQVMAHFMATRGQGYDYWGVGRFGLPFLMREHPSRWFCSEWCATAMGIQEGWRLSPAGLHLTALALTRQHGRQQAQ